MTEKKTWEHEDPKLWAAVTAAFGPDWPTMLLSEMYATMTARAAKHQCSWCGKTLGEDVLVPSMFPSKGPFCSDECGGFDLQFYCLVEGK